MELLDEIIGLLSSENPSLVNALFKTQVLAHRLKEEELKIWVERELKGYSNTDTLPKYRTLKSGVFGRISNGVRSYENYPIPILDLDEEIKRHLLETRFLQGISVLERLAADGSKIKTMLPPESYAYLSKTLNSHYVVEAAWTIPSAGSLENVLSEVRYRLLNFVLELSEKTPAIDKKKDWPTTGSQIVNEIFKHTIIGDNATILIGSGSIQGVNNSITKGDIESLSRALLSAGLNVTDIDELRCAIKSDKDLTTQEKNEVGPSVREWMGKMFAKAGSAGWQVTLETAGNLLASAIAAYYGFSK